MGQSTDAILAYGWDLGDEEGSGPEWAQPLIGRFIEEDYEDLLIEISGVDVPPSPYGENYEGDATEAAKDAYFAARKRALDAVPVTFELHCSGDYPSWLLSHKFVTSIAHRGSPRDVGHVLEADLRTATVQLLGSAVKFGVTPDGPPSLLIASYWS